MARLRQRAAAGAMVQQGQQQRRRVREAEAPVGHPTGPTPWTWRPPTTAADATRAATANTGTARHPGHAVRRVGQPDEVAQAVVWLCSELAGFVTGAVLPIDGGKLAGTPPFRISPGS